jgi:hypothetical protein
MHGVAADTERRKDADDQQLVGERVEVGTELGLPAERLGEVAVDRVGDAGDDKQNEGELRLPGDEEPEDDRHQDHPQQRDEVGEIECPVHVSSIPWATCRCAPPPCFAACHRCVVCRPD